MIEYKYEHITFHGWGNCALTGPRTVRPDSALPPLDMLAVQL